MKKQLAIILVLFCSPLFAQKASIQEGNWKNLKDITKFNLEFDYSNVEIPNYDNEEAFLKDKMQKREEKLEGDGERFKKSWFDDRKNRYEPKFIESFNKRWDDKEVQVGENLAGAEHTLKIHTTFMYPGYNVGVMRQNSKIDAVMSVYRNDAPNKILFEIKYTKAEGTKAFGVDYNSGDRIAEAYAKLAKTFAANLQKKAK